MLFCQYRIFIRYNKIKIGLRGQNWEKGADHPCNLKIFCFLFTE